MNRKETSGPSKYTVTRKSRLKEASPRSPKIEFKLPQSKKAIIEKAADIEGVTVTAFIMSRVYPEAQNILAERATLSLSDSDWDVFNSQLDRKPKVNKRLSKLLNQNSILENS